MENKDLQSIIADQIKGEWDAIENYKIAINELKHLGGSKYMDAIKVIESIIDEEETHVGELQNVLCSFGDNICENVDDGKKEAKKLMAKYTNKEFI